MVKNIISAVLILAVIQISAQEDLNMSLISHIEVNENGNDIWGYVDGSGTEYAIMGSLTSTWIWSLEDPANPIERARIVGDSSIWRDIKSWQDHLYVTTDTGDDGLLVIDMSLAPDSIRFQYITPEVEANQLDTLAECHNLYIDENGFCYLSGCRIPGANKAIILDLNQDKWTPPIVGIHGGNGNEYSHDLYVKNNMMYASEINVGELAIYDVTRKDSIVKLGSTETSFAFTHNAWTSEDQNYVFTTDERANAYVDAYDISDPTNIIKLDRYRPLETEGRGVIPHNTHYYDGYLVTSYYTDGVVIIDANDPSNLIKVGSYDTFLSGHGGFRGCWGAYPYLPSGLILASDRNSGLYVLDVDYERAALLEGFVSDEETGSMLNAVDVSINASQMNESMTDASGLYKTGLAGGGEYEVTFSHPDYFPKTETVELENGLIKVLDVSLTALPTAIFSGQVVDKSNGEPIPNAVLNLLSPVRDENLIADDKGFFSAELVISDYSYIVGQWGYQTNEFPLLASTTDLLFELEPGISDNFALDLGWTAFSGAISGDWVREEPIPTFSSGVPVAPGNDDPNDIGTKCYVTGNGGGGSGTDDIDEGAVVLVSPNFNVSDMQEPTLEYMYWFANLGGEGPINDTMFIQVCDNINCVRLDSIFGNQNFWSDIVSKPFGDVVNTSDDLRIEIIASDIKTEESSGHPTEAAIDAFAIVDASISSAEDIILSSNIEVYPNPFDDFIKVWSPDIDQKSFEMYDAIGNLVKKGKVTSRSAKIDINLASGIYTLKLNDIDDQLVIKKIVKK